MITIKTKEEIEILREGGKILAFILRNLSKDVNPGVRADYINSRAEELAKKYNAIPSFKGYNGFPASICVSINEEVVHGFPFDKIFKAGDIVGLDFGLKYKGLYTDHAVTIGVGGIGNKEKEIINITKKALNVGIKAIKPDKKIGEISHSIQEFVEKKGYAIVRDLTGHGVGYKVHEAPQIPNFGDISDGPVMKPGMVFAIEPMVNQGSYKVQLQKDGWTFVTADGSLSAHFEHTVVVTKKGYEILTK